MPNLVIFQKEDPAGDQTVSGFKIMTNDELVEHIAFFADPRSASSPCNTYWDDVTNDDFTIKAITYEEQVSLQRLFGPKFGVFPQI